MPVSSLVFVVIVAIWAAYLVQHWARRREDAAATRSMEGFSEAMRVLEKRPALPAPELSTPRPHSYAVKPASPARTTVDVKRAVPAGASRRSSPLVARRSHEHVRTVSAAVAADVSAAHTAAHDIAPYAEVDRMPQTARPTTGPVRSGRPDRSGGPAPVAAVPVSQRRLRAALLLLALVWLPVSVVLTVTGLLMWVSVPFAVLTLGAVLVWLRAEARADRLRPAGGYDADSFEPYARSSSRGRRHDRHEELALPVLSVEDTQVIRSTVVAVESAGASVASPARHTGSTHHATQPERAHQPVDRGVFDVLAMATGPVPAAAAPVRQASEQATEGSWSPVPVPVPTYVLKAKAEPRWTDSGIPADVFDTPEFAEEAEELDDRALFARRAVSQ